MAERIERLEQAITEAVAQAPAAQQELIAALAALRGTRLINRRYGRLARCLVCLTRDT